MPYQRDTTVPSTLSRPATITSLNHTPERHSKNKTEGFTSPWKHHQSLITFAQHSPLHRPFRIGGTVYRLSVCGLFLSVWYLRVHILHFLFLKHASLHRLFRMGESDYEFTFYTFCCSNMLLSIAYFAWGKVIIYDDNLYAEALLKRKEKYISFFFFSFWKKDRW